MKLPIEKIEIKDLWSMTDRYSTPFSMDDLTERVLLSRQDKHFEALIKRFNRLVDYRNKQIKLEVGMRIKIGKRWAKKWHAFKEGEFIDLIEGYFEYDDGFDVNTEMCPSVWNEQTKEFDSIYHIFGNDLEEFMDCEIIKRERLCKNCRHCSYQYNNENQEEEFKCEVRYMIIPNLDHWGCDDFFEHAGYVMTEEGNSAIGMDWHDKITTGAPCGGVGKNVEK